MKTFQNILKCCFFITTLPTLEESVNNSLAAKPVEEFTIIDSKSIFKCRSDHTISVDMVCDLSFDCDDIGDEKNCRISEYTFDEYGVHANDLEICTKTPLYTKCIPIRVHEEDGKKIYQRIEYEDNEEEEEETDRSKNDIDSIVGIVTDSQSDKSVKEFTIIDNNSIFKCRSDHEISVDMVCDLSFDCYDFGDEKYCRISEYTFDEYGVHANDMEICTKTLDYTKCIPIRVHVENGKKMYKSIEDDETVVT